jgi:heme-degrading monooxygenase HmoA
LIRLLIEYHARSREDTEKLLGEIRALRNAAMKQNGYITGETLIDISDPCSVLVIGTWDKAESWNAWDKTELRASITRQMLPLLATPPVVKPYKFAVMRTDKASSG